MLRRAAMTTGELGLLAGRSLVLLLKPPWRVRSWVEQMDTIGVDSVGVALVTSLSTGMIVALQASYTLPELGMKYYAGTVVAKALIPEMGPVLMALIVGGRIGSGIAAELATMKVTEQVDALRSMAADPVQVLVVPKLAATLVMLPVLTILGNTVGIFGGLVVAVLEMGLPAGFYLNDVVGAMTFSDIFNGIGKSFIFGGGIAVIACHSGLGATGGADGVGRATTRTVVLAAVMVVVSDFFLTKLFYLLLP